MPKLVILLAGATYDADGQYIGTAQSGKDKFAEYLIEAAATHGIKAVNIKFADELKAMCDRVFTSGLKPLIDEVMEELVSLVAGHGAPTEIIERATEQANRLAFKSENWYERKNEFTRVMLQLIGTDVVRSISPNQWAMEAFNAILKTDARIVVISDLRFPSELGVVCEGLRRADRGDVVVAYTVARVRPFARAEGVAGHESEREFPKDLAPPVFNNGSLDDLRRMAEEMMEVMKTRIE